MKRLVSRLPSLRALVAFEAVVRLGSVTAAARELGSTQPSVSQHLRVLEQDLQQALFGKAGRGLKPTPEARELYRVVAPALNRMADGADRLREQARAAGGRVVIRAHFGFAHLWLLPRLDALEATVPGVQVQVEPEDADGEDRDADIEVVFGRFDRRRVDEVRLFCETVYPVCSPGLAQAHGLSGETPASALARLPLLHMDEHDPRWLDWTGWLQRCGVEQAPRPVRMHYKNYPLLLNAAMAGQGVALGWRYLIDPMVADGRLLVVGASVRRDGWGYMLRPGGGDNPLVGGVMEALRELGGREYS